MMQGDSYSLGIEIVAENGTAVTAEEVLDIEITIGSLRKTYASGSLSYDSASQTWKFPLSQEETFKFLPSKVKGQVRVFWKSGDVEGAKMEEFRVSESISKEVLYAD